MMYKTARGVAWVAALGMVSGASMAATTNCPAPPGPGQDYVVLTTSSAFVQCWDWGSSSQPENDVVYIDYPTVQPTTGDPLEMPDTVMQLGKYDFVDGDDGDGGVGTTSGLTVTGGNGSSGTFYFNSNLPFAQDVFVVFKTGNNVPSWFAFRFLAGFVSSETDTWQGISPAGTGPFRGLSHFSVWSEDDQYLVPIPAAAWLLGSGLLGLFAVGRRRKGSQVAAA